MQQPAEAYGPMALMAPIQITLFGSFQMSMAEQPVKSFRSHKARALLVYLLLAGERPLLRTDLIALLWSDYTATTARANLRQTLFNLREVLAPFTLLHTNRTHVQLRLDPTQLWCDLLQADALLTTWQRHEHRNLAACFACQERLEQALALGQGALLGDFPPLVNPPFDAWLVEQRTRIAARLTAAAAALAAIKAPGGNLPPDHTSFVGRNAELLLLVAKLNHPHNRCLTLVGPGGIGKSRLAQQLGQRQRRAFPDGVWFVSLAGVEPPTSHNGDSAVAATTVDSTADSTQLTERVASLIGTAIGVPFRGAAQPSDQVAAYLRPQTALLLLDNFEQVEAAAGLIPRLLAAAPMLRVLITSRHTLALTAQLVHWVEGLPTPNIQEEERNTPDTLLARYPALQLFVERAAQAGHALPLDPPMVAVISELCRLVAGSPWAIELAVALLDQQSPAAILAAIQRNYRSLHSGWLDLPPRHQSAEALLRTIWGALSAAAQQQLAGCAVFRGGFTSAAATTITGATPADLQALVRKSLLHVAGEERWTLHELVRQYAAEQLAAQPGGAAVESRHAAYYLALVEGWQPGVSEPRHFRQVVQAELTNVEAAWQWALRLASLPQIQTALPGLAQFYRLTAFYQNGVATFKEAIARLRPAEESRGDAGLTDDQRARQRLIAHLTAQLCLLYNEGLGDSDAVIALAPALIAWGETLGEPALQMEGYYQRSTAHWTQGNWTGQEEDLAHARALAQTHGLVQGEAQCHFGAAMQAHRRHETADAIQHYQQALTLAQQVGDRLLILQVRNGLGSAYRDHGDWSHALDEIGRHLTESRRLALPGQIALATSSFGALSLLLGDFATAQRLLTEACTQFTAQGEQRLLAETHAFLGYCHHCMDKNQAAIEDFQTAIALATPGAHYVAQRIGWNGLGEAYLALGRLTDAHHAYQQGVALTQSTDFTYDRLLMEAGLSNVLLVQGQHAAALALLQPALTALAQGDSVLAQLPFFLFYCYHVLAAHSDPRADELLQQAWSLVQEQAARISNPRLRTTFLTNFPLHRDIAATIQGK